MKRNFLFILLIIVCFLFSGCAQTIVGNDENTQIEDKNYGNSKNLFVLQ